MKIYKQYSNVTKQHFNQILMLLMIEFCCRILYNLLRRRYCNKNISVLKKLLIPWKTNIKFVKKQLHLI